jgi:hypothetical protein
MLKKYSLFLTIHNIEKKGILNSNFVNLYKLLTFIMHNSHMEKIYYKWVDINLSSSYVNVVHIIKLIKWTLGQVFFLLGFGPPNHAK